MVKSMERQAKHKLDKHSFKKLYDASSHILKLLSELIPINTFFVAINDKNTNYILNVLNRHSVILLEGSSYPFDQTYSSLVVKEGLKPLVINDITKNADSAEMAITKLSGMGSFIGIPITDKKGNIYGTICAMDSIPFVFTQEHAQALESFSDILSYIVELENLEKQISSELKKATKIQKSVLPPNHHDRNLEFKGVYYPAMHLSGDMYYWVKIDENRYGVLLIDVMGHGVSAALISMALRSLMKNLLKRVTDPVIIFQELNTHLFNLIPNKIISFATGVYLMIDTSLKTIEYINAGHPPCILYLDNELNKLESSGTALGLVEAPEFTSQKIVYEYEYQILLYTDGLLELLEEKSVKEGFDTISASLLDPNVSIFDWLEDLITKNNDYPDDISILKINNSTFS
jgi:phosphoserine phosphatase RsbU/P